MKHYKKTSSPLFLLLTTILFITSGMVITENSHAGPLPSLYIEANLAETKVKTPGGEYKFSMSGFKLGYYLSHKVAVELQYMKGLGEDGIAEITNVTSLYLRIGTDARKNFRSYILLGQSNVSLNFTSGTSSITESLEDFSWVIGAEERLRRWPLFFLNAEFVRHYDHDGGTINSASLGLRYEFH